MPQGNPEHGGVEESLWREIEAITLPALSDKSQNYAEASMALGLTHDDYLQLPEEPLVSLVGASLNLVFEGASDFTYWEATHLSKGKLVVHEKHRTRHIARYLVGGSVFCPASPLEKLQPHEADAFAESVWQFDTIAGVTTPETDVPAMIMPEIICRDAMLSLKRIYSYNELRQQHVANMLVGNPQEFTAMALEQGPDKTPIVYFVSNESQLTMPVTFLARRNKNDLYQIF